MKTGLELGGLLHVMVLGGSLECVVLYSGLGGCLSYFRPVFFCFLFHLVVLLARNLFFSIDLAVLFVSLFRLFIVTKWRGLLI